MLALSFLQAKLIYVLAQTESEKQFTAVGLILLAAFFLLLFLDASIKGKWVPKSTSMKTFLMFLFVVVIIVLILLTIYYF